MSMWIVEAQARSFFKRTSSIHSLCMDRVGRVSGVRGTARTNSRLFSRPSNSRKRFIPYLSTRPLTLYPAKTLHSKSFYHALHLRWLHTAVLSVHSATALSLHRTSQFFWPGTLLRAAGSGKLAKSSLQASDERMPPSAIRYSGPV